MRANWIHLRNAAIGAVAAGVLAGCASTNLVSQWRNPDVQGGPYKKLLLVAVAKAENPRRIAEDAFAKNLSALGVASVTSYSLLPEVGQVSKERVEKAVADSGADAALVSKLVKVETKTITSPGMYSPGPSFYGHYQSAWTGYYDPPTTYQSDVFTMEVKLFDAKSSALIWSGITETADPGDPAKEIGKFATLISQQLRKLGLL
jgi:hypothetical protein